jgi:hypothetical protein
MLPAPLDRAAAKTCFLHTQPRAAAVLAASGSKLGVCNIDLRFYSFRLRINHTFSFSSFRIGDSHALRQKLSTRQRHTGAQIFLFFHLYVLIIRNILQAKLCRCPSTAGVRACVRIDTDTHACVVVVGERGGEGVV